MRLIPFLSVLGIVAGLACSCSDKGSEVSSFVIQDTVVAMNFRHPDGFDFSTQRLISPSDHLHPLWDSLGYISAVDSVDFYLAGPIVYEGLQMCFGLTGSPVGRCGRGFRSIGPDTSKPSVMSLSAATLNEVAEIPSANFVTYVGELTFSQLLAGPVFAIETQDSKFAAIQILSVDTIGQTFAFAYKYQPSGSRRF
jgi:hypothetical protein